MPDGEGQNTMQLTAVFRDLSKDRTYRRLFYMNALFFMVVSVFLPYLPAYYQSLGFSMVQIGVLASLRSVSAILIQPFWSYVSDRTGNRLRVLRIVLAGSLVAIILFSLPRTFAGFFLVVLLFNAMFTSVMPIQNAVSLNYCNESRKSYAGIRIGGTVGYALLVIFAGRLIESGDSSMTRSFLLAAGGFLIMLLVTVALPKGGDRIAKQQLSSVRTLLANRRLVVFLAYMFFLQMGMSFLLSFLSVHIRNLGLGTTHIGIAMCLSAASEIPVLLLIDSALRRASPARLILTATFFLAVRLVLTASATGFLGIAFAQLFHGLGFMTAFYSGLQFVNREVPDELKASGVGLLTLVQAGFASILSSVAGGVAVGSVFPAPGAHRRRPVRPVPVADRDGCIRTAAPDPVPEPETGGHRIGRIV